jgi:hypothetical protein
MATKLIIRFKYFLLKHPIHHSYKFFFGLCVLQTAVLSAVYLFFACIMVYPRKGDVNKSYRKKRTKRAIAASHHKADQSWAVSKIHVFQIRIFDTFVSCIENTFFSVFCILHLKYKYFGHRRRLRGA